MGRTVLPAEVLTLVDYCQHSTNNHHPYTHNSLVDGEDGQDSVPPDVCVSDLKTSSDGWHERLKQFRFLQLAQEAKSGPSDELIRMLEILKGESSGNSREGGDKTDMQTMLGRYDSSNITTP